MVRYKVDQAYKRSSVATATPLGLIIMLYDGMVVNLARAERSLAVTPGAESARYLKKAQDIICELMGSLDFEKGGEIAGNLYRVYEYMNYRLIQANLRRDPAMVAEVRGLALQLKEAWEEAERKLGKKRDGADGVALGGRV
ncbi:MAG: flagellar export chaperone FliS [Actinobacteria bacterium]|nr:flagellar export chaperone FliS [Actinomycetota bacterium]